MLDACGSNSRDAASTDVHMFHLIAEEGASLYHYDVTITRGLFNNKMISNEKELFMNQHRKYMLLQFGVTPFSL